MSAPKGPRKRNRLNSERANKTKPGLYADGHGLYLSVSSATARSWLYRYTLNGKTREMGLGSYPQISVANARNVAAEARTLKARGIDPLDERARLEAVQKALKARSVTFESCAKAYIAAHEPSWRNEKHAAQWAATLETYVYPAFGDLPVQEVDAALVHKVLEPIWSTKTETARRLRGRIEAVLDWAKAREYRSGENPARWKGQMESLFPRHSKVRRQEHHAALPYKELPEFMSVLATQSALGAMAMQLIILTAARTSEVLNAKWSEFDLETGIWTVPGERMKGGRDHRVPLSKPALILLKARHLKTSGEGYVFPGRLSAQRPASNMVALNALKTMGRRDLTVHGFRSTFRDWAEEETNHTGSMAEAALAHAVGDKVEAAYRRGDLFEKRRELMKDWANYCTGEKNGGNVVQFTPSAAA